MKLSTPYKCDYCSNIKGESNHWWLRLTWLSGQRTGAFVLWPWDDELKDGADTEHICSEACAVKALSKWMGEHKV